MKQAIAGVVPASTREAKIMTVWPSVAAMHLLGAPVGRFLGRLYSIEAGFYIFTVGNLVALLSIPLALLLYMKRIGPFVGTRYCVTNKRIVVLRGITGKTEEKAIELDRFDKIEVRRQNGDEWFDAGDLIFLQGTVERFMLEGVSRPESFRQVCWKARQAYVGVKNFAPAA